MPKTRRISGALVGMQGLVMVLVVGLVFVTVIWSSPSNIEAFSTLAVVIAVISLFLMVLSMNCRRR